MIRRTVHAVLLGCFTFAAAAGARAADTEKGKVIFEKCAACHSLEAGKNDDAPNLKGIFGRKIASVEEYRYSAAMKRSDLVWTETTLNTFLEDPQAFIPGNRMPFDGLKEKSEREDLLAYLAAATKTAAVNPSNNSSATSRVASLAPAALPYIDAHTHIDQHDPEGAVALILSAMERLDTAKAFIQTEPYGPDNPARWDAEMILPAVKKHPQELAVLGGGGTLNPMILDAYRTGNAGPEIQKKFRARAEELIRLGAVGFGELSTEHLSLPQSPVKDYEYAPADSPLMLLLADIAAEHNVPIDLHMEALPQTMPTPAEYGPPNPPELHGNIAALERLLAHNPGAKIIWAHAGSDNIGYRTPELCRQLLQAHPNLYMEIKFDPGFPGKDPPIVEGKLKPEWLKLYTDFPDRFIIGSDQHFDPPATAPLARAQQNALLLNQLPPDLRQKIATGNALRIYGAEK